MARPQPELGIDPSGRHLTADGAYWPVLADTAWSSFSDPSESDWRAYLEVRRRQGFTGVFVALLPIPHDRTTRPGVREPFALDAEGHPLFDRPDDAFWEAARRFTRIAHEEYGLRLLIAVLWNSYLPGTWGAQLSPWAVMPVAAREEFVRRTARELGELAPILVVGGDDLYDVPEANAAYQDAVGVLRDLAPGCLLTTHTAPNAVVPDELLDALDFHLHQSGHNVENQELTWRQPAAYLARRPRRPLVASEPPYELHGRVNGHGRWSREEVRARSWESVLAGASAGVGYGAHGMWMWHTPDGAFAAEKASLAPLTWTEALALPGALDLAFLGRLLRDHGLHRVDPAQELLVDDAAGSLRAAASVEGDLVAIYLPVARRVPLTSALEGLELRGWDLATRAPFAPRLTAPGPSEDPATRAVLEVGVTGGDLLVIAERAA